jgi:hypothetical protein
MRTDISLKKLFELLRGNMDEYIAKRLEDFGRIRERASIIAEQYFSVLDQHFEEKWKDSLEVLRERLEGINEQILCITEIASKYDES